MPAFHVRPAIEAELPRVNAIWFQNETAGEEATAPPETPLASLVYLHELGALRVAAGESGDITGFGAALTWRGSGGSLTYLSDLFVAPGGQSHGVGQALLESILEGDGARVVLASKDPRATALYIRWGMRPRWPHYWVAADMRDISSTLSRLPGAELCVEPTSLDDEELIDWDTTCFGYERPGDLRWLVDRRDAQPFWLTRGGRRAGYAFIQRRCDESIERPDAWTIGPVGARTPEDAAACVGAVTRAAAERAPSLRLALPGPHPALPFLIAAGFRIVYTEVFLASEGARTFDPALYVSSGVFL